MGQIDTFVTKAGLAGSPRSSDTRLQAEFTVLALGVGRGSTVLDLPCGNGRHSLLLARKGCRVTAVDVSADCIRIARTENPHRNIEYKRLDIQSAGRMGQEFDAVVSLLSCLGYFATEAENESALRSLLSVLKKGGRVMLSTANRAFVQRTGTNRMLFDVERFVIERIDHYDDTSMRLHQRFSVLDKETGGRRTYSQHRRIYSKPEIMKLLRSCGIGSVRCFADYHGSPFSGNLSPHAVYVGTKRS